MACLIQLELIQIGLMPFETQFLIQPVGRYPRRVGREVDGTYSQLAGMVDAGHGQRLADAFAAPGFVHDHILNPGFESAGNAEDGQGGHADDRLVSLAGEEEGCGAGGEHFVQFGHVRRGDSGELRHQALHGGEELVAGLTGLFEMDFWVHGN